MDQVSITIQKDSFNEVLGIIWGFASVADIVDLQDEIVPQAELEKAVYAFVEDYYRQLATIKLNHDTEPDVVLVETALLWIGGRLRWYVGVKLNDEALIQDAIDGKIKGFSIGGSAERVEVGA